MYVPSSQVPETGVEPLAMRVSDGIETELCRQWMESNVPDMEAHTFNNRDAHHADILSLDGVSEGLGELVGDYRG